MAWEAAHGNLALAAATEAARSAATSPLATSPGLTMGQLLDSPPSVDFPWGPATRCYSTHLHAAEGVVAQRSLQRAAAYKPPSTRLLNKIRKWLAANQSATGGAWGLLPRGEHERRCLPQLALCARDTDTAPWAVMGTCLRRVCLPQPQCHAEVKLNEGQERAIEVASDAPLMVLTGGPGCGKTTAVQTIVKLWCAQKKMVRIAAPTGEAEEGRCAVLCCAWV